MKLTFLGAAHEVTGSCTLLEAGGKRILVDCGMEQGADIYENADLPVTPAEIDAVLLTHAHIDHSGKIPLLVSNGFTGPIYCTLATYKLCSIMLLDSAHIQEFEANWRNRKAKRSGAPEYTPLYTTEDAQKSLEQFRPLSYHEKAEITDNITAEFFDAGHLLGSSSIKVSVNEGGNSESVLFSGDLGNINRPLINDPEPPVGADYVVIESTYGNRLHKERPDYVKQLTSVLQRTFDRGGNVVIPCFAVGRTQELLYLLRIIKERGLVKEHGNFPVYVDSPLAAEATNIYSCGIREYYDSETLQLLDKGIDPIKFDNLRVSVTSEDSVAINFDPEPKVILSASGMCEAGRIRHHLKHNLWKEESTILFVGYQSEGTLGRSLVDGKDRVKLFGEEISVRAEICTIEGISGHADRDMLLGWLKQLPAPPKKVFVNHGNDTVCDEFSEKITEELGFDATAPYNGASYSLYPFEVLAEGNRVRIQKSLSKGKDGYRPSSVFVRLQSALKRLSSVVSKYEHAANKDIAKFADTLNSLCDKWDMK